jgi:hypothetical protein
MSEWSTRRSERNSSFATILVFLGLSSHKTTAAKKKEKKKRITHQTGYPKEFGTFRYISV